MPCAEGGSVTTTVAEDDLAAGVGDELAGVWAAGGVDLCAGGGAVEEIDVLHEAGAGGDEVADALLRFGGWVEGVAVGGHEDADVAGAGAADVEARKVLVCFWIDDAVPGLVGDDAPRAGAGAWWWAGHLVEHFEAVVPLFDHLGPG